MHEFITTEESLLAAEPAFRRVLSTGAHSQIVSMSLEPGEEIGAEVHDDGDQIFVIMVPQGVRHNVANTGSIPARVLTIYAPAQHAEGLVAITKADAAHE